MTGAPKLRTMALLEDLERGPRGIYSGALGYMSVDGGADLSIVIRTIIWSPQGCTVGTGGAIVADSTAGSEFDETVLKAAPQLRAIARATTGNEASYSLTGEASKRARNIA